MPASDAGIVSKLGRCPRCMVLSAQLCAGSIFAWAAALLLAAPPLVAAALAGISLVFTAWLLAHGVAWTIHGRKAPGCQSCQRKGRTAMRRARWLYYRNRLFGAFGLPVPAPSGCNSCAANRKPEDPDRAQAPEPGLRDIAERSSAFVAIRDRLAQADPVDEWMFELKGHFVYALAPGEDGRALTAYFVTSWDHDDPVTAVIVPAEEDPAAS